MHPGRSGEYAKIVFSGFFKLLSGTCAEVSFLNFCLFENTVQKCQERGHPPGPAMVIPQGLVIVRLCDREKERRGYRYVCYTMTVNKLVIQQNSFSVRSIADHVNIRILCNFDKIRICRDNRTGMMKKSDTCNENIKRIYPVPG